MCMFLSIDFNLPLNCCMFVVMFACSMSLLPVRGSETKLTLTHIYMFKMISLQSSENLEWKEERGSERTFNRDSATTQDAGFK